MTSPSSYTTFSWHFNPLIKAGSGCEGMTLGPWRYIGEGEGGSGMIRTKRAFMDKTIYREPQLAQARSSKGASALEFLQLGRLTGHALPLCSSQRHVNPWAGVRTWSEHQVNLVNCKSRSFESQTCGLNQLAVKSGVVQIDAIAGPIVSCPMVSWKTPNLKQQQSWTQTVLTAVDEQAGKRCISCWKGKTDKGLKFKIAHIYGYSSF